MLRQVRPLSYVARGATYEDAVAGALGAFGIALDRVGGANDRGIDLRGFWAPGAQSSGSSLDSERLSTRVPVSVQCKRYNTRPVTPRDVREFEGAVAQDRAHAPASCLGILASATGFSTQAKRCAFAARGVRMRTYAWSSSCPRLCVARSALARSQWPLLLAHVEDGTLRAAAPNAEAYTLLPGLTVAKGSGGASGPVAVLRLGPLPAP